MAHAAHNTSPAPEAPVETDACPIDMDHLLHYTMGDEDLAREVLGLFCTQGRLYLEHLSAAATAQDRKNAAHTLKGSAQGVGAHQVATLAFALEKLSDTDDGAAWSTALTQLDVAFNEADAFVTNQR